VCIQNLIIHIHVHVDYNPLKGILVLIPSLKLSIVSYAAGPKSRSHSRTAFANISMSSCFPSFIVRWILNIMDQPTHENHENWYLTNKSDFTVSIALNNLNIEPKQTGTDTRFGCNYLTVNLSYCHVVYLLLFPTNAI